tara:strand:+ start:2742 stop:3230 length:489 start_codon:yes stop_codon:yes gene_type:complete
MIENMNSLKQIIQNRICQITLLSAFVIFLAYIVEIFARVPPCELCIYQRIPYFLVVFFGVIFFIFKKETLFLFLTLILFIINFLISVFHSLVERGVVNYKSSCTSNDSIFEDIESLRQSLENTPIAKCDEIIFSIMGFSLANINLIVLTLLITINILFIIKK